MTDVGAIVLVTIASAQYRLIAPTMGSCARSWVPCPGPPALRWLTAVRCRRTDAFSPAAFTTVPAQ